MFWRCLICCTRLRGTSCQCSGNRPSHWQYLKRTTNPKRFTPLLFASKPCSWGSIVKWSVSSWGVKYWRIATSSWGVGCARNEGFWPTVALPPDLASFVRHDSATSRASINLPAPILRQGLWHRPEGASYADWLCAGVHPGAELRAAARRAGAERLYQGVS